MRIHTTRNALSIMLLCGITFTAMPSETTSRKAVVRSIPAIGRTMMNVSGEKKQILTEPPAGAEKLMIKEGTGFGCDGMFSVWKQPANGTLVNTVTTSDGKFYMNSVFSQVLPAESGIIDYGGMPCDYTFEYGYLEGIIKDDVVEFALPQIIERQIWDLDMGMGLGSDYIFEYEYYAVACVWDEESGTYVPADNQTFRMNINSDGSLTAENPDLMIGQCVFWEEEEESDSYYAWQMNGDINISLHPQTAVVATVPSDLEYETWNLVGAINARPVQVAFRDDTCYITGLCTGNGMESSTVIGTVSPDRKKVSFDSGQFMGNYFTEMTEAWFIGYTMSEKESVINVSLDLDLDMTGKVISATGCGFAFSTMSDRILSFQRIENPYIAKPRTEFTVRELPAPIITQYLPADDYYDAELMFDIPTIDIDRNLLDSSRLSYSIILGQDDNAGEFVFYTDEYTDMDEDMDGTTEIPFGYTTYDFSYDGANNHGLIIYPRGYTVLGVRTNYDNGTGKIYSPVAFVEGLGPTWVSSAIEDTTESVTYYDLQGFRVSPESKGLLIRKTVMNDGTVRTSKIIVR